MIQVERLVNELMNSNCYIVWDDVALRCIIIDPASEKSLKEIAVIEKYQLVLDCIFLTHEHTDHTWGVNSLIENYPSVIVICSQECKDNLQFARDEYFQLYFDLNDYHYQVSRVDNTIEELAYKFDWHGCLICLLYTPGHSIGSICIDINGMLFTGDTIMQFKPYINRKDGNMLLYKRSVKKIISTYKGDTKIFPGHGVTFNLIEWKYCQSLPSCDI